MEEKENISGDLQKKTIAFVQVKQFFISFASFFFIVKGSQDSTCSMVDFVQDLVAIC